MKIISVNLNGIRAAAKKEFFTWMKKQQADIICIQETKAQPFQLADPLYHIEGYHIFFNSAEKKGYSGVAIYSKSRPDSIDLSLGTQWGILDKEGRFIQVNFGQLSIASLYLPSGSSGETRQTLKYQFLDKLTPLLHAMRQNSRSYILCGDWNIAHKEIDLKNWKANQKHSGFLPAERAFMDQLFNNMGFVDAFRVVEKDPDHYTWWSNRGKAWEKNVGWRIDYQIITPDLKDTVNTASIYKAQRFSDHAPLIIEYQKNIADFYLSVNTSDNA